MRLRRPEGSLASWPGDGFNSQLDGDESAKGFWVASYTSALTKQPDPDRRTRSQRV